MIQIILGAGLLNCLIGFLVLRQSKHIKEIVTFGLFCVASGIWSLSNVLKYYDGSDVAFRLTYALGALGVSAMLAWSFLYRKKEQGLRYSLAVYLFGTVVFIASLVQGVVIGDIRGVATNDVDFDPGILFDAYNFYIFVALIGSIINTFIAYRNFSGDDKRRARLVLIGLSGFAGTSVVVSAILPAFGILRYTDLDSPSSLIFVLFATIAIVKHHFLGTKVILAQVLVSTLVVISLI